MQQHLPLNPFADPTCTQLWEQFMAHLEQRALTACIYLLDTHRQNTSQEYQWQFIDYCHAIYLIETDQWDRSERLLLPILQCDLHPAFLMRVLNARAIVNDHLGRLAVAMRLYQAARDLAEQQNDLIFLAKATKNSAICAIRLYEAGRMVKEQFLSIRADLEKSIQIFQTSGERLEEGRCWNELGAFYKALDQWQDAIICYEMDMAICQEQNHQYGIAFCQNNIGEALIQQADYTRAEALLREAAARFAAAADSYEQADALVNLGRALSHQQKHVEADGVFTAAIACVESVRSGIGTQTARNDFFATQAHIYGAKIAHCLQQDDCAGAFNYTERARARGLLEMIAGAATRISAPVAAPSEQWTEASRLQSAQGGVPAGAAVSALEQRLAQLYVELQLMGAEAPLDGNTPSASVAQIVANLPADTVLLSYFALDNRLIAFVVSPLKGITVHELVPTITDLRAASFDHAGHPRGILPSQTNILPKPWLLERLYVTLVQPLIEGCRGHRRLVIVPHGPLHHLPLHAAYDRVTGHYLCEQFDIVYAPSATIQTIYLPHKQCDRSRSGVLALLCGNSGLQHASHEVHAIANLSGGLALTGTNATTGQLLELAHHYRYLHFAGHAWFRRATPLLSGFELADRRLTVWDILQLPDLGFALVCVNGCESGLSQVQPGDELLGLLRALLYAVAPAVLLTLWPIEDLAASLFAQLFYRALCAQPTTTTQFSQLLRNTVQKLRRLSRTVVHTMLQDEGYAHAEIQAMLTRLPRSSAGDPAANDEYPFDHPYFWAGYLLNGEAWAAD